MTETKPNEVVETTKKETTELITDGKSHSSDTALSAVFDKMEQGKTVQEAAAEVKTGSIAPVQKTERQPAKETAKPAPDEQKKLEETGLNQQLEADQAKKDAEAKAAADALKTQEVQKSEEVPEEELQVLQTDKPKTAKRIQALLERTKKIQESEANTKKELEARDVKLKQIEDELAKAKTQTVDPATQEALKQREDELAMFRRRYELDNDPVVKSKFDDRIVSTEKPIGEILTRHGAAPLSKIVEEEGGWLAFSRSHRQIQTADGVKPAAEVAELVLQNLPFADRQTIQSIAMEQIATKREKDRFFEEEKKKAVDYFKQKDEQAKKGSVEYQRQVAEAAKVIEDFKKDMEAKNEWLKEKEVPANASTEQKAAIEEDNRHTKQIRQELDRAIGVKDIPGMLEVVKNAVQYHQERRAHARTMAAVEALKKDNAKLKDELDNFRKASKTTNKAGSLLTGSGPAHENKKEAPKSLEEAFDLIASGKSLSDDE